MHQILRMSPPPTRPARAPLPSNTQGIGDALAHSEPLALLARRLRESQDRLAAIAPLLPPAMRAHVRHGPVDEQGWALLVQNNAVAAKLRQMLPAIEAQLRLKGFAPVPGRVRLLARGPGA
jgi:hypothetical protein